jgi:hypothetical protein
MLYKTLLMMHICGAVVGLLAGFTSMAFRKGSGLHAAAGNVFFISIICMSLSGAFIAAFIHPNNGNVTGGLLLFYLVSTAWVAARRRQGGIGFFDFGALLVILGVATADATWGIQAAMSPSGLKDGYPAALYLVFGAIALLFAASDVRVIVRGGVTGAQRIARHLWRMCLALLFATASLYPGQWKLFPMWLRHTNLLYLPHAVLIGAMLLALVRVSLRKRVPQVRERATKRGDAVVTRLIGATGQV